MRTTVVIDDDVLTEIETTAKKENRSRRDVLNEVLRVGVQARTNLRGPVSAYTTPSRDVGRCLLPSLDDVSDVLAVAEGDGLR